MDNESSGFVDLDHLTQLFESYKDGLFKDFVQKAKSDIQSDIMLNNGDLDSKISKDEFAKFMNSLIVAADLPKFQDQIMNLCMNSVQVITITLLINKDLASIYLFIYSFRVATTIKQEVRPDKNGLNK